MELWLIRHGATEWSSGGRHTGRTDVPLSPAGENAARALRDKLAGVSFDLVLSSPLQRARRTAELAGLADPELEPGAVEWDYGQAEGLTRGQLRERIPDWSPWTHEMPGGESLADLGARADRLLGSIRQRAEPFGDEARVVLVAHGHFLRVLSARWIGQPPALGQRLALEPATVSVLGYDRETPVLDRWNC